MPSSSDIIILGGGVIGLTTAYFLAREGAKVSVVDKGDLGQESSWAGAGIISPGNPKRARSPAGQLRALSSAMWPELSRELRELTGIDNGYLRCGGLELRQSEDALEKQRLENLLREERGEGAHCEVLDQRQLHQLEPALAAELPGAVHFPDMAQVRNPWHVRALIAACTQRGVKLQPQAAVLGFERREGRILGVETDAGQFQADRYLIAAGAWSGGLLQLLGLELGIKPIRGQIVLFHATPPLLRRILLTGAQYLVPRADGRILAGSTEEDVGFQKQNTPEGVQALRDLALRLVPQLAQAIVERTWAGLRPGSPDGKPFLGRIPEIDNLFVAAGHYRSGLQNSPGTGLLMKELLLSQPLSMSLDAFGVGRVIDRRF
jgi:glycine oxidase